MKTIHPDPQTLPSGHNGPRTDKKRMDIIKYHGINTRVYIRISYISYNQNDKQLQFAYNTVVYPPLPTPRHPYP